MNSMLRDPELMRIAQEQMRRMSPEDMARIQQEMMSNPDLVKMATENMNNMSSQDIRNAAEQLNSSSTEDIVGIGEKMAKVKPEDIAAMRAQSNAYASYGLNAAQTLKQQGNELHGIGKFHDASQKYLHAKRNLKGVPMSNCRTLQLQCSLNLMSCYLKTKMFNECIKEGSEVLSYDSKNVKALYRRGQAYKEIGNLKAATTDLTEAHDISPDDETIVDVLRDTKEKLSKLGLQTVSGGLTIEEIVEEKSTPEISGDLSTDSSASTSKEVDDHGHSECLRGNGDHVADAQFLQGFKDDPEAIKSFQNYVSNTDLGSLAAMSGSNIPPEMIKTATDMIGKMKPDELQNMLKVASSLQRKDLSTPGVVNDSNGPKLTEMTPEMVNFAAENFKKMSPDELQKIVEVASSAKQNSSTFSADTSNSRREESRGNPFVSVTNGTPPFSRNHNSVENTVNPFSYPEAGSSSSIPTTSPDLQNSLKNSMKDPAMQKMFKSMMRDMNPDMLANMSEQFGLKLSKDDVSKAQQAMSSLSADDLDRMLRWAERAQKAFEKAKKIKNWLLGKPGLILAIFMLVLAFLFHQLGFIGRR